MKRVKKWAIWLSQEWVVPTQRTQTYRPQGGFTFGVSDKQGGQSSRSRMSEGSGLRWWGQTWGNRHTLHQAWHTARGNNGDDEDHHNDDGDDTSSWRPLGMCWVLYYPINRDSFIEFYNWNRSYITPFYRWTSWSSTRFMQLRGGRARTGMLAIWGQSLLSSDHTSPVAQTLWVTLSFPPWVLKPFGLL